MFSASASCYTASYSTRFSPLLFCCASRPASLGKLAAKDRFDVGKPSREFFRLVLHSQFIGGGDSVVKGLFRAAVKAGGAKARLIHLVVIFLAERFAPAQIVY